MIHQQSRNGDEVPTVGLVPVQNFGILCRDVGGVQGRKGLAVNVLKWSRTSSSDHVGIGGAQQLAGKLGKGGIE